MKIDGFVKAMLVVIAVLLALNCVTSVRGPANAEGSFKYGYVQIGMGYTHLPGGGDSKLVVDLRNGNVWGFPLNNGGDEWPAKKPPVYIGKYDFSAMDQAVETK